MKRLYTTVAIGFLLLLLSGCADREYMDVLCFTENFNGQSDEKIEMSDYYVKNNIYSLPIKKGEDNVLVRLVTDTNGDIGEIRVTLSKTDEGGTPEQITEQHKELYYETVKRVIRAFTYSDERTAAETADSMKLRENAPYSSTGEITAERDNYYFILFSTDVAVSFTVKNIHISPVEKTEKPESRPAFGNTTNIRTETVPLR